MNSQPAPLVNRLILVVLGGILGCLILLVIRVYRPAPTAQGSIVAETGEASAAATLEPVAEPDPAPIVRQAARPPARPAAKAAPVRLTPVEVAPNETPGAPTLID